MRVPVGRALQVPAWLLLGVLVVLYAAGIAVVALLMVLTATVRLLVGPPLRAGKGLVGGLLRTRRRTAPHA